MDDSIGDAFDKGGRFLGLPWVKGSSYGAALEKTASFASKDNANYIFPLPLSRIKNSNFSFSGLKTSLFSHNIKEADIPELAYAYQKAIVGHVTARMKNIPFLYEKYSALIVSGGVARNSFLLNALKEKAHPLPVSAPASEHCTDNALMIANAAAIRLARNKAKFVEGEDSSEYFQTWSLEELS